MKPVYCFSSSADSGHNELVEKVGWVTTEANTKSAVIYLWREAATNKSMHVKSCLLLTLLLVCSVAPADMCVTGSGKTG